MPSIRFAVAGPDGTCTPPWIAWTNPGRPDVYISPRGLARHLKVSLHDGAWRLAYTTQYAARPGGILPPGEDRAKYEWAPPPEFIPGVRRALTIHVPGDRHRKPFVHRPGRETVVVSPPPAADHQVVFAVLYVAREYSADKYFAERRGRAVPVARIPLPDGRTVWIAADVLPMTEDELKFLASFRTVKVHHRESGDELDGIVGLGIGHHDDGACALWDLSVARSE